MPTRKKPSIACWKVVVKDDRPIGYEIAVVRSDNRHGISSYGWPDKHKYIVACDSHGSKCHPFIWKQLKRVATDLCYELNRRDRMRQHRLELKKLCKC